LVLVGFIWFCLAAWPSAQAFASCAALTRATPSVVVGIDEERWTISGRVNGPLVVEAEAVAQDVEPRGRLRLRAVTEARDWGPVSSR
jgi:hypothetical protein